MQVKQHFPDFFNRCNFVRHQTCVLPTRLLEDDGHPELTATGVTLKTVLGDSQTLVLLAKKFVLNFIRSMN